MIPILRPFTRPWLYGHIGLVLVAFYLLDKTGLPELASGAIAALIFPVRVLVWKWPRWRKGLEADDPPVDWLMGAIVPAALILILSWMLA
jgi:hypothetical protein